MSANSLKLPQLGPAESSPRYRPEILGRNAVWVLLLNAVMVAVFQLLSSNGAFLNSANVNGILISYSQVLLLVIAQTMLIAAGQIDLSQGANVVLSSVVSGVLVLVAVCGGSDPGAAVTLPVMLMAAMATGALIGCLNGILVGWLKINSLVATLGMLGIVLGAAQVITNGDNLYGVPLSIQNSFGVRKVLGLPAPTLIAVLIVGLVWLQFSQSRFGTYSLAIGSSEKASRRNGVPVARQLIVLYIVSGIMCGIGGAFDLARFTTTDIGGHANDALASISGAVIGGTSLLGGRAHFVGAMLGGLLALILQSGLVILNFPPFYQTVAIGVILIIAVAVDRLKAGRGAS